MVITIQWFVVKIENSYLLHKWEKCCVHCVRFQECCQNEKKMICEELAGIILLSLCGRAGRQCSRLMLADVINYRSVWGCWSWHTSQPAHYQRQELPLQETGACHSVVTPGTFHHSSSSHINIFKYSSDGEFIEWWNRSDGKQECPKLRFRRKGCTYKYECKEECVEKKDCKTTYQYKCKEYRKQVTDPPSLNSGGKYGNFHPVGL